MEGTPDRDVAGLELACWNAACQALATVAPRWGLSATQVRDICERGAQGAAEDLVAVQLMAAGLIQHIEQQGADREELLQLAQDAFETHRRLHGDLTVADLF